MLYREMFDEVHAPESLQKEVMNMTRQGATRVVRKVSAAFVIAAVLAVILAGTAIAATIGVPQTLQEWFGKQWTESGGGEEMPEEQSAVIDSLVQPIGVTCINKGVTITLDSVTPGEGGLWLLYKVKGEALENEDVDRWNIEGFDLSGKLMENEDKDTFLSFAVRTATMREVGVTEDKTHIFLMFYDAPKGVDFLEGGELELWMKNITMTGEWDGKEGSSLPEVGRVDAKWVLPFTLTPTENVETLTVKRATVPCSYYENEKRPRPAPMEITDIQITAMGISFIEPAWKDDGSREYVTSDIALQMKNGMEIQTSRDGVMGAMYPGEPCSRSWDLPADLSKVEAIRFDEVVIPLKQENK